MSGELVRVGSRRRQGGVGPNERVVIGERILDGRIRGEKMYDLAERLSQEYGIGISEPTAYRWMQLALDRRVVPTVDEFRKRENERLDATQRDLEENISAANAMIRLGLEENKVSLIERGMNARMTAIGLQLRLSERRAKLNGLDAPIKVEATVSEADPREAELAEMVREARARAAREAQEAMTDG